MIPNPEAGVCGGGLPWLAHRHDRRAVGRCLPHRCPCRAEGLRTGRACPPFVTAHEPVEAGAGRSGDGLPRSEARRSAHGQMERWGRSARPRPSGFPGGAPSCFSWPPAVAEPARLAGARHRSTPRSTGPCRAGMIDAITDPAPLVRSGTDHAGRPAHTRPVILGHSIGVQLSGNLAVGSRPTVGTASVFPQLGAGHWVGGSCSPPAVGSPSRCRLPMGGGWRPASLDKGAARLERRRLTRRPGHGPRALPRGQLNPSIQQVGGARPAARGRRRASVRCRHHTRKLHFLRGFRRLVAGRHGGAGSQLLLATLQPFSDLRPSSP